jgi:RNA polymerase sigma factor (sigma-70 family)
MPDVAAPPPDTDPLERSVHEFARTQLGPASERLLRNPEPLAEVVRELRAGRSLPDATLACLYRHLRGQRQLADEFAAYFLFDLMRMGRSSMSTSSKLRRFLDTGDLVLSVFGDLWTDFSDIDFESTTQFKSLFAKRVNWKAIDQARRMNSGRRREDQRLPEQPEDLELPQDAADSPLPQAIRSEERDLFILILLRLEPRDRQLLTLRLKGLPLEDIAQALGLSAEATRKATDRAILKARRLATGDGDQAGALSMR